MTAAVLMAIASTTFGATSDLTYLQTITTELQYPARLAPGPGGGVYVTDPPMGVVTQFDAAGGVVNTYVVPQRPIGIAVHADGRIFLSRADGDVGVYDAAFTQLGLLNPAPMSLIAPNGMAMNAASGELFVVDAGADQILVFEESTPGTWTLARAWGMGGGGLSQFHTPQAIAVDPILDHVIVTDVDNFRAQVFDAAGTLLFRFGYRILYTATTEQAWFARSEGLAVDACSNIYVADALMGTVRAFDSLGHELDSNQLPVVGFGSDPGQLRVPCDVMIDGGGKLYVANTSNASVEVFTVDCTGGAAGSASAIPMETHKRASRIDRTVSVNKVRAAPPIALPVYPDDPTEIAAALYAGIYRHEFDLNQDLVLDVNDLSLSVERFGAGTVEQFLSRAAQGQGPAEGRVASHPGLEPPHITDIDNRCSRCHNMDGAPGGMLSATGQENLCLSCHSAGKIAGQAWIGGGDLANNHPWGVEADGLDPLSELALHLDGGNVRCGTCHEPHEVLNGKNYLRMGPLYEEVDLTVPNTTKEQPMTVLNPTLCGECHTDIVNEWHVAGHSHEHADPFIHYEWFIGNNWLCTGPGTPYAYCTDEGAGTAASPSAAICTGPGTPLACCTGVGTGSCSLSAAACTGPGTPWSCCTGAGAGSCSSRESCRQCHSGYGYIDFADDFPDGAVQTSRHRGQWRVVDCLTCHTTHGKPQDDSLLRIYDEVRLPSGQILTDLGPGATCAACHNGRAMPPFPNPPGVTTPHYLSGGVMLEGVNGVTTFDGAVYDVPSSSHTTNAAVTCVACHMAPGPTTGTGVGLVGGHTFNLKDHDSGFENVANTCATSACHPGLTTINRTANGDYDGDTVIEGVQDETSGMMTLLKDALYAAGASRLLVNADTGLPTTEADPDAEPTNPYWTTTRCVGGSRDGLACRGSGAGTAPFNCPGGGTCTQTVPAGELATVEDAIWNWEFVDNSGDFGVKNTGYAVGLLQVAYKGVTNNAVPGAAYRYTPAP